MIDYNNDEVIALQKNLNFFYPKSNIQIINKKVTKDNINYLVKNKLPHNEIDFLSLDIDGNDYWVLKNLQTTNIKVICCEYNHWLGKHKKISMKYNVNFKFKDNGIWGASLLALTKLLKKKNFLLVAVESSGTNDFFVNKKYINKFKIICPKKKLCNSWPIL